jgi:hypothetical protein
MKTVLMLAVVGDDADNGNRLLELVRFSVPARNRLTPSSWLIVNNSGVSAVNVNRKTVASAKFPKLKGRAEHVALQVAGVGAAGLSEAKKPPIVLRAVSL